MRDIIWYDYFLLKHEEFYFKEYISLQIKIRSWFKIITLLFSAGGIFSAFKDFKIPTIISVTCIGLIQMLQLIENQIVINDETLDHFKEVRSRTSRLCLEYNKLFHKINYDEIDDKEAFNELDILRTSKLEIDDFSEKKKLYRFRIVSRKAENDTKNYFKTYYNVEI